MIEKIADKLVDKDLLSALFAHVVGACSTLWLFVSFATAGRTTRPLGVATRIAEFLGIPNAGPSLAPIEAWFADPRRVALWIIAACLAGILVNLSATLTLKWHHDASAFAWLMLLVAIQGLGATMSILIACVVTAVLIAVGVITTRPRSPHSNGKKVSTWDVLGLNCAAGLAQTFYPVFTVLHWVFQSYRGEMPYDPSDAEPAPTGAVPLPKPANSAVR